MSEFLSFYCGDLAHSAIRKHGLTPDLVKVVAGAAGGPKWLILGNMDRFLFKEWFSGRKEPLFLLGSSAGAWRFAAASRKDPSSGMERLADSYINQWYSMKPSLEDIDKECKKVLDGFIDNAAIDEILGHPYCRLNFFSVRSRGAGESDSPLRLIPSVTCAALSNAVRRRYLNVFFRRTLFYNPASTPPFFDMNSRQNRDGIHTVNVPLSHSNFKKALLSSGSIPLVMPGVRDIPEAPEGVYRDGGTIDYHLDVPFINPDISFINSDMNSRKKESLSEADKSETDKIVLFPHYTDRVIPGWLDKKLPWRKADPSNFRNVLLITPTRKFTEMLPGGKIPERRDFTTFKGANRKRITRWKTALKYSEILGEEICKYFNSARIENVLQPVEKILI